MRGKLIITLALLVAGLGGAAAFTAYSRSEKLSWQEAGVVEYNWTGAVACCEALGNGARLPDIFELTGLMYRGALTNDNTDYWSRTALFGYAFGVNTRSRILSFDRQDDIDHVVCVK